MAVLVIFVQRLSTIFVINFSDPNPNGLFGVAALVLDYNDSSAIDITAKSHYDYYQLTTHNSSDKNN